MTERWWYVCNWRDRPEPVTVTKHTEHMVWVLDQHGLGSKVPNRRHKLTDSDRYIPTWEEARAHIMERNADKLIAAEDALNRARKRMDLAKQLPEKEPA